jgi:hypothetical protein
MVILLVASALQASEFRLATPDPDFNTIQTFRCELGDGEGHDYARKRGELTNIRGENFGEVIFDSINYRTRTARLIGNVGSGTVKVIDGELAVTFIETTLVAA